MTDEFEKGDHVTWNSHGGTAEGTVERKITADTEASGRTVRASEDDPQYEVRSEKSGGTAVHKPGRPARGLTQTRARRRRARHEGDTVTEPGDQFAGTSQRSTKHSPRVDEELEHEIQGMVRGEHATRAEEWRDPEPVAEGDPDIDADPTGTLVGGTPVGMDADAVEARAELARWLDRADFPSTGADLVEAARDHRAPGRRRRRARAAARRRRPSSGSATSSARWATRPRPDPGTLGRARRPSVPGVLPGLLLGDLLGAAAAEQPRAGEALHHLAEVLDGVDQVVDVGADVPERLQDREDVLVQVRDQPRAAGRSASPSPRPRPGRGSSASRRTDGASVGERRLVVAEQRLDPADQALGPVDDAVGARPSSGRPARSPRPPSPGCGRRPRWRRRPSPGCAATPSIAASAFAWVAADALDGRVGLGPGGGHRVDRLVGPVDDAVHPVQQPADPVEVALHPAERRAQPGDERQRLGDAVPHVGHGGEDVGGAGHRRQSHPRHATHLVRWPTIRLRQAVARSGVARSAARPAW